METLKIDPSQIEKAAALLRSGGIVAFPTETVYGLGACIWNEQAIQKIYTAKGRPSDNPLIAHVASLEQAKECAADLPEAFMQLAKAFWPGPLSMVVKKSIKVPLIASAGLDSIAIRMPSDPVALELIEKTGAPLVAPSANRSGFPSGTCSQHVLDDFDGVIEGIVLGKASHVGIESTVLSLLDPKNPVILRSGVISAEEIASVLQRPVLLTPKLGETQDKPLSPGMKYRHYSPLTPLYLFDQESSFYAACSQLLEVEAKYAVFCSMEEFEKITHFKSCVYRGKLNPRSLYQALRALDQEPFDGKRFQCALILSSAQELIWPRLIHATAGEVNLSMFSHSV